MRKGEFGMASLTDSSKRLISHHHREERCKGENGAGLRESASVLMNTLLNLFWNDLYW